MNNRRISTVVAMMLALNLGGSYIAPLTYANAQGENVTSQNEQTKESINLVKNNGFEENVVNGEIPNWRAWNGGSNYVGIDTENMYEGSKCAYIVPESSIAQVVTNLKPNTSYEYKAYVKLDSENSSSVLGVKNYGADEIKQTVSGTEYKEYGIKFTTGNQTSAEIYLWDGSGLGTTNKAYIDNVSLNEIPYIGDSEVKFNMNRLQLTKGEIYDLISTIKGDTESKIIYSSSDESIATVDDSGKIKAISSGNVNINASLEGEEISATCKLQVTDNNEPWYSGEEANWKLTMEDNFEGNSLDTSLWTVRGKEYAAYHRSDMVKVEDGKLKLSIEKEPDGQVVLGRVDTHGEDVGVNKAKFDQKYGFFEASAKIPPTEQTYFAFWMFNYPGVFNVDGTGREGTEIDITETVFQGDSTESTLHWDGYEKWHKSTSSHRKPAPNIHDGFHRYGLEWDENSLKFYFDGELTWTYKGDAVPLVKEILIFSSGLGMWGEGDINNADLPYVAEVDWVRTYTKESYENRDDSTKPMIYGAENVKIEKEEEDFDLLEGVWAIDNKDDEKELTDKIIVDDSKLDINKEGVYKVTYKVTDKAGNTSTEEIDVQVVEDEDEVDNKIFNGNFELGNLSGWSNSVNKEVDTSKVELAQEEENYIAKISPNYEIEQFVNLEPGETYKLSVKAKGENNSDKITIGIDGRTFEIKGNEWKEESIIFTNKSHRSGVFATTDSGNTAKISIDEFILEEVDNDDEEAPTILGADDKTIKVGENFDPKDGVTAVDNKDGDLTRNLDVKGRVDINKAGVYKLIYTVKDSSLNIATKERVITVQDDSDTTIITKDMLVKLVADVEKLKKKDYTIETWNPFKDALKKGKVVSKQHKS
ncbi:MAG: immunoglobulin-like domain-containing protein, partial [Peptostreptococcaceae bacterium]